MLCEKCKKNNATFFYEENVNGKKRSYALCNECAQELKKNGELTSAGGFFDPFTQYDDSIFGGLFSGFAPKQIGSFKTCPGCGATLEDFRKLGKAGCADCYKTFSGELEATIRSIHGSAKHSGRAPKKAEARHKKEKELKSLKKELKTAIENEEFEKAASLRDRIREMEGR